MNKPPVSISLSSYGADLVRQRGQGSFIDVLAAAGATRIEWREELLTDENPLQLADDSRSQGLESIYSAPMELWLAGQSKPNPELLTTLERAETFGAKWLKVSLGYFTDNNDLQALSRVLAQSPVQLLVENDQTLHGGRIEPFQRFFGEVEQHQLADQNDLRHRQLAMAGPVRRQRRAVARSACRLRALQSRDPPRRRQTGRHPADGQRRASVGTTVATHDPRRYARGGISAARR